MYIVSADEMYEIDKWTINSFGLDEKILMENAGRAAATYVANRISTRQKVLVLVGSGNNGGDGFVIARTLADSGYQVRVLQVVSDEKITGTSAYHKNLYVKTYGELEKFKEEEAYRQIETADVIIDALLGIGVKGKPKAPFDQVITWVNQAQATTFSVDIPSGIPADGGSEPFSGVKADFTVIIEAPKPSVFIQRTAPYYGKWDVVSIGIPVSITKQKSYRHIWQKKDVRESLPARETFSHKGSHGKGLIIGGARDMPGSVTLTAGAALRAGAGLITAAVPEEVITSAASHVQEATFQPLASDNGRIAGTDSFDVSGYDAVAIGMGMGREQAAGRFTRRLVGETELPVLIDADGLYHIKENLEVLASSGHPRILTPHPGEMAMLTDLSIKEILENPFRIAKEFAVKHRVYLLLKGAFTIVTTPDGHQYVNTTGNAGLAKGGSGDALSGILLAMIMKKQSIQEALSNGCFLHGLTADILAAEMHSPEDMLASDLISGLPSAFRYIDDKLQQDRKGIDEL